MMPLVSLAAVTAGTIAVGYTIAVAREARRPRRATYAWALAHGLATEPDQVSGVGAWNEGSTTLGRRAPRHAPPTPPSARSLVLPWWVARGSGSGTMVLVHGWGRSRWDSLRRLPWLLDHAGSIVLPDLRGHGEAPGTTSIGHADHLDLEQVIHDALGEGAWTDLTLVGHSMGAMVATRLAARLAEHGTPARRLVLMAPYDSLIVPMANRLRLRGLPSGAFAATAAWWLARGEEPLHRTLARVGCPVLVLGGQDDTVTTPTDVRMAVAPHQAFIEAGVGHADVGALGTASRQALDAFLSET